MICDDHHWSAARNLLKIAVADTIGDGKAAEQALGERAGIAFRSDQRVDAAKAEHAGQWALQGFRYGDDAVKNCCEIHCLSNAPDRRIYSGFASELRRFGFQDEMRSRANQFAGD